LTEKNEKRLAGETGLKKDGINLAAELDETQSTKIGWTDDEIEQLKAP
jgi:hypothetical protein